MTEEFYGLNHALQTDPIGVSVGSGVEERSTRLT